MTTLKQQAAEARAFGLKRFTSEQPCRYGHNVRLADRHGACETCFRLRKMAPIFHRWSAALPPVDTR